MSIGPERSSGAPKGELGDHPGPYLWAPSRWPVTPEELEREQVRLAALAATVDPWRAQRLESLAVGALFAALPRGDPGRDVAPGDPVWVGAVVIRDRRTIDSATVRGRAGFGYRPGYLALQLGPALAAAVRTLDAAPDVLLVNATGRDHPRGAGLALHLGAIVGIPTVGVTDRPLAATGPEPSHRRGSATPLLLGGARVGHLVRTRPGVHPIAVHAAWRTDPDAALAVVLSVVHRARTPEPLQRARRLARVARTAGETEGDRVTSL